MGKSQTKLAFALLSSTILFAVPVQAEMVNFTTELTGASEVPPSDTSAKGTADVVVDTDAKKVTWAVKVEGLTGDATAAHIHLGVAGQAGDVKVMLAAPTNGSSKGCVTADKELIKDIIQNPANYYINVHNAEFPKGAVRGQLNK